MMDKLTTQALADLFSCLNDPTRIQICNILSKKELSVKEILEEFKGDVERSTLSYHILSYHLVAMYNAGLLAVRETPTGVKRRWYSINTQSITGLQEYLGQLSEE
jgi:DNA-binding transcriptional ArsR family regulator